MKRKGERQCWSKKKKTEPIKQKENCEKNVTLLYEFCEEQIKDAV